MDDFESRLSDGLSRRARDLPVYRGDFDAVRRRGRNRRWAARGTGALGVLALLGGGVALYNGLVSDPPTETLATSDGGDTEIVVQPTPTPTPDPTPDDQPAPTPEPTPESAQLPSTGGPDDSPLLVATGWGVGLLNQTGSLFAPITCCTGDDASWYDQDTTAGTATEGALSVRDDLRGGLVTASSNTLRWTPSDALATSESLVLATAASPDAGVAQLILVDVQDIDGEVRVLYATTRSVDEEATSFVSALHTLTLGDDTVASGPEELDVVPWTVASGPVEWRGGAWLPNGAAMTLRADSSRGCAWVEFTNPGGPVGPAVSPYPKPGPSCERPSLDAATVNDQGDLIAIVEGSAQGTPRLVVYELVSGTAVFETDLRQGSEEQGWWTEIDMVDSKVLLSRGSMDRAEYGPLDESVIVDIAGPGRPQSIPYFGSPAFPRAPVSTAGLDALELDSPLRFLLPQAAAEPEPTPDTTSEPEPTPEPTPQPTPEPTPVPDRVPPELRMPTGRLVNVVSADALVGADGCAGPADATVCLGGSFEDHQELLDDRYGDERTDDPATFLEGDPHPDDVHVWLSRGRRVTLTEDDGITSEISFFPDSPEGLVSPFSQTLTIGDVLFALGAPAEILQGGGEGVDVVVLSYDTEAAFVSYSFVQFWGEPSQLVDRSGPLEKIPVDYLDLPIVAYRAEPAG